jgi:hypothetical protein
MVSPRLRRKERVVALSFVKKGECVAALKEVLSASEERQSSRHFKNHIPRLSWALCLVPIAESPDKKLLDIGSKLDILEIFRKKHGYSRIDGSRYLPEGEPFDEPAPGNQDQTVYHFNGERALITCEPGTYDVVTCFEVIEHMPVDPMGLMGNINRALAMGGHLILSTVNCASLTSIRKILAGQTAQLYGHYNIGLSPNRHNREYTTRDLKRTVTSAGFKIVKTAVPYVFSKEDKEFIAKLKDAGLSNSFLGDDTVILAEKVSDEIVRFPSHLYVGGNDELRVESREVFSSVSRVQRELVKGRKWSGSETPMATMHFDE